MPGIVLVVSVVVGIGLLTGSWLAVGTALIFAAQGVFVVAEALEWRKALAAHREARAELERMKELVAHGRPGVFVYVHRPRPNREEATPAQSSTRVH